MTPDVLASYLRKVVPEWGQEYVDGTLASDPDAAASLAVALHDYQRADVVAVSYGQIAPAAFRKEQEVMFQATPRTFKVHDDQDEFRPAAERCQAAARRSAPTSAASQAPNWRPTR